MSNYHLFGIQFIDGSYKEAFYLLQNGKFMVVPSGPGLATIDVDKKYWNALKNSDFAIPDSGFMVILYRLYFHRKIKKLSGPKFIKSFFREEKIRKQKNIFLIDPNHSESQINRKYLNSLEIPLDEEYQYISPIYDKNEISDVKLLKILENLVHQPDFVLINLGGGVQERLGSYLKNNLSYNPGIICTGAAISFLTGSQVKIPNWVDGFYLGWLVRIINNPAMFIKRYIKAFRLFYVFYLDKKGKLI